MKLEICANSLQSSINADLGGANRIELCSSLNVGGLTPSYGLIIEVLKAVDIPINVLIRPRAGDFVYSEKEIEIIKHDVEICKELGVNGIVCGFLNMDDTINTNLTQEIIRLARPLTFTFHRAFDLIDKPEAALEKLISLNVDSVLTSGTKPNAEDGIELLKNLKENAGHRIEIIPGSGINSNNIHLFKKAGFNIVHSSASSTVETNLKSDLFGPQTNTVSDLEKIMDMLKIIT